ncbi:hypothetical protein [Enterobacter asburiae]|uniref:hypothetical protein n=1 Tax=Enterobacter asburiae TaxID=61645 RepID=UPI00192B6F27|nr:hypothetical protein [Enterobacter asburiae]
MQTLKTATRLPFCIYLAQKSKKPALKAGFSNLAPLTGIAFANNWLNKKLNLNSALVKTTKVTTNRPGYIN